jgi:uridine kinase
MQRADLLKKLSDAICAQKKHAPILVGIDGVDGAGKTTLTKELVHYIKASNRKVVTASIDGFHNPQEIRIAKGTFSPEGYFYDSFDYEFLISEFLQPLKSLNKSTILKSAKYDWKTERVVGRTIEIDPSTIDLFEGVFLFRSELETFWDYKVYVQISTMTSLERGLDRDSNRLGGTEITREKYLKRYIPGQKIYHDRYQPHLKANFVVKNDDPTNPEIGYETDKECRTCSKN